ncbi:hypothetical protein ACWGUL_01495 [Streptomyces albidoflavus]
MNAEGLQITPTKGPSCEGVRDLIVKLLESHPLVSSVAPAHDPAVGLQVEIGGLDFEVWVDPA